LTDLARSFLPKDLKGLLPTSAYMGTATFETPQVAFAYERGWRDSFKRAGFPGPEEEFELAQAQLLPHAKHKILLDASCGSGLFTRRFVQSKNYASVVGLDFSAAMLTQARAFAKDEGLLSNEDDETDETDETDGRGDSLLARLPRRRGGNRARVGTGRLVLRHHGA
jgi:SAM-dependent methyltransferase